MNSATRWLDVEVGGDDIELNPLPANVVLLDLHNDNDYKLLVGDLGKGPEGPKIKIFKGAMQISDWSLPDVPLGVVGIYTSNSTPRSLPVIAVAFGSCIYVFKNMKLFYKYYLPSIEFNTCEMGIWKQLSNPSNHNQESMGPLIENLIGIPHKMLSSQSKAFLAMSEENQIEYLEQLVELPAQRLPEITCITSLRMNSVDRYAVSCLVVGTEDGEVLILDPQTYTILSQGNLHTIRKTPFQLVATGLYTVDYRITIATREKSVCLLKRDWEEARVLFNTEEHIISIEVMTTDGSVLVICTDNTFTCYSKKGKKQWSVTLEHRPVSMTLVSVTHLSTTLVAVSLASGHVHLFDGKARPDTIFVTQVASVMKFGQLGQEEHVLIIITSSGNLQLKILKRTADFSTHALGVESSPFAVVGQKPWLIPKKSKLFLEQSIRERENAVAMHESFQYELNKLRLVAAKTLLEAHQKSDNCIATGALEPLRLSAEVEGLGPVFKITLIVENTSTDKAVIGLSILFHVHISNYKIYNPYMKVPLLSPGSKLQFPTKIEEIFEENINPDLFFRTVTGQSGERSLVKVLLLKEGRTAPVLAATVQMPPTDPLMLPLEKIEAVAGFVDS